MASFAISRADKFPSGTTVYAYPRSNWLTSQLPPSGSPQGSATTSATAGASGVTFSGLADGTRYVAYAQVSGVDTYVGFTTDPPSVGSIGDERGNTLTLPTGYRFQVRVDTDGHGNPVLDDDGTISINDIKVVAS